MLLYLISAGAAKLSIGLLNILILIFISNNKHRRMLNCRVGSLEPLTNIIKKGSDKSLPLTSNNQPNTNNYFAIETTCLLE